MKKSILLAILIGIVIIGFIVFRATRDTPGTLYGISLSPQSHDESDVVRFFKKADEAGDIITWAGICDTFSNADSAPYVLAELSVRYSYEPVVITDLKDNFADANVQERCKNDLAAFARRYKPRFIGIGNEINFFYETSSSLFDERITFYKDVRSAIKEASPNTNVFTVFQLEQMEGMQGGLFNGVNDIEHLSQWELLAEAEEFDLIAFTTYPGLVHQDPEFVPSDYYNRIVSHTDKPIAFTEIGWFRDGPQGWPSSEEEQADFISRFSNSTKELAPMFAIWSFLYDQNTTQDPFTSMGLIGPNGEGVVWDAWKRIQNQ